MSVEVDSYIGILDQEAGVIESMSSSAFAPMVLPVLFIIIPPIISVCIGITLNLLFPREQPGELAWLNLGVWYPLEIWYVVRKWKDSLKNPWLNIRYWVGKVCFSNDFQVIKWVFVGEAKKVTALKPGEEQPREMVGVAKDQGPGKLAGPIIEKPESEFAGDLIYEFHLRNKTFPRLIVALKDIPERMLSFVGNVGLVQNGGLLFESRNIATVSFIRCDFTHDDVTRFIPVGVFSDCAQIAQDITEARKVSLPEAKAIEEAPLVRDAHRSSGYKRLFLDEAAIRENVEKQSVDLEKKIDNRVAAKVKDLRKAGQIPVGPQQTTGRRRVPGSRGQWVFFGVMALIVGGIVVRLLVH